jgi:hypothetical protein
MFRCCMGEILFFVWSCDFQKLVISWHVCVCSDLAIISGQKEKKKKWEQNFLKLSNIAVW